MANEIIETDYLVVGTGATAMAFVDTLLGESEATVVMVDRHHRPGGHWNDAYPFVRLHQPSAFYGVDSRALGSGAIDAVGLNAGLAELASGAEVLDYFEQVMNQRLLPSGRVRHFPMCVASTDRDGVPRFRSLLDGTTREVRVRRKCVDATHARTEVPSTHPPAYRVADGVPCIPVHGLPEIRAPYERYVVVGAGKTGIDACLWLLQNGIDPGRIRWIAPRDAWLIDRANVQSNAESFERSIGAIAAQLEAIGTATSIAELFARLEADGLLLRLDPAIEPGAYRCATVSRGELAALRRIRDVVRLGRVVSVEPDRMVLERGGVDHGATSLVIDCSANGIPAPPTGLRVFDGDRINLLFVLTCQPTFSAAVIAWVECHVAGDAAKNALCSVVPSPDRPTDWLRMWAVSLANRMRWRAEPGLAAWLAASRLDFTAAMLRAMRPDDAAKLAVLERYGKAAQQAGAALPRWLRDLAALEAS